MMLISSWRCTLINSIGRLIRVIRSGVALFLGGLVTAFHSGLIVVFSPIWMALVGNRGRLGNPLELVPYSWLNALHAMVYWPVLGIRSVIEDQAGVLSQKCVKVVEMNHGSFMEMFLGYKTVLNHVSRRPVIVVKQELAQHWFTNLLIVKPMLAIHSIILVDRKNGAAAKQAITEYIAQLDEGDQDVAFVILCDQTRPTDKKRAKQNEEQGANWQRVLRPSRGGTWTLTNALLHATDGNLLRLQVGHGLSRPQHTELDIPTIVGTRYWARITKLEDPLPSSPELYGPDLLRRFEEIDEDLVSRQET